ncbi:protein kinase [Isosphaeraceae bacterium EP7]
MTPPPRPCDAPDEPTSPGHVVALLEPRRDAAEPTTTLHDLRRDADGRNLPVAGVAALIKADMRDRFSRGDRRAISGYLAVFPEIGEHKDLVLSLVYEEFCLREEGGENPDPESFCDRYAPWRDSIASQLRYHRPLSMAVGKPAPKPWFPSLGQEFCRYRLRSILGEGGSARVYLANQPNLPDDRYVALKVSLDRGTEPAIMSRLEHDHIVPVLSVEVDDQTGMRGLCMPYSPGLTLDKIADHLAGASTAAEIRQVVTRQRGLFDSTVALMPSSPPAQTGASGEGQAATSEAPAASPLGAVRKRSWDEFPDRGTYAQGVAWIGMKIAEALAYAHRENVLHLDVKPANILLTWRNGPRLLDFNLSHDPHAPLGAESALRGGTLPYMAPEQLRAFLDPDRWGDVGQRADLYSLGLVLSDLLTGKPPEGPDPDLPLPRAIAELCDHRQLPLASVRDTNPSIPRSLDLILAHCLAPRPEDRYADGDQLAEDLRRFLASRPLAYARSPTLAAGAMAFVERTRTKCLFGAALTLLVALLLIARFTAPPPPLTERDDFRDGVIALAEMRAPKALATFERLRSDYNDSPLLNFYLGLASDRNNLPLASERYYKIAFQPRPLPGEFLREVGHNPLLGKSVGEQGHKLHVLLVKPEHAHRRDLIDLSIQAYKFSLALDDQQPQIHFYLACAYEKSGQYEPAIRQMTRAIELTAVDGDPDNLVIYSLHRVRLRLLRADQLIDSAPKEARSALREATDDLVQPFQRHIKLGNDICSHEYYYPARIRARFGDLDRMEGEPDLAADRYRDAERLLTEAIARFPNDTKAADALLAEVRGRLKELENRPPASAPTT